MGSLLQSFDKTKLDLENSGPDGIHSIDTITVYSALSSGTPTSTANPGAPENFHQPYTPSRTYLDNIPIKSNLSPLNQSLNKTNLDITDPGVDGGIPYKQVKDPTVYPPTTQGKTPIEGYYATSGQGATKFDQKFGPTNTYLDYIK
jgi:hypothetical protein